MAMKEEFGLGLVATGFPRIRKVKLINDLDQMANLTLVPLWLYSTGDYIQPVSSPGSCQGRVDYYVHQSLAEL